MKPLRRTAVFALLAAGLLLGQGVVLHHDHASAADCPPATCSTQGLHSHASPVTGTIHGEADCPACEMLGQGRVPPPEGDLWGILERPRLSLPNGPVRTVMEPTLLGSSPRAPPRTV